MGVCDVPVIHTVCNVASDAAGAVVTAPFDWLAQGMAGVAKWMFESIWTVIDSTTYVDVTSGEYTGVYNIIFGIAVFVMLAFFMLQVIGGMIRREPGALSRAGLGLAKSILGSFVPLTLLATALEITDQLCIGIVNAAGTNMNEMGDKVALLAAGIGGINLAAPGAGIRKKKTKYISDAAQRQKIGQIEDAQQTAEYQDVLQQEADLTVGHGVLRCTGLVAVSASDPNELERGVAAIEQAAIQASCETQRLWANRPKGSQRQRCLCAARCD